MFLSIKRPCFSFSFPHTGLPNRRESTCVCHFCARVTLERGVYRAVSVHFRAVSQRAGVCQQILMKLDFKLFRQASKDVASRKGHKVRSRYSEKEKCIVYAPDRYFVRGA